jgi:hypothetical protein
VKQNGYALLIVLFAIAVIAAAGLSGAYTALKRNLSTPSPTAIENITPFPTPTSITTPSVKPTIIPKPATPKPATPKPATPKPTTVATTAPAAPSCNYDLNAATGAIEFRFQPTKGSVLYWSTRVEVKAQNGCKVLDGRSTDTIQPFASTTQLNAVVPGIPPGTYDVRYSYHDNWSSSQSVSVSSGGRTEVNYTVDNSSDP